MVDTKTKFDYEIDQFEQNFFSKKNQRLVLYGTGRMTATLLERLQGFHIVGLLDRDPVMIGKTIYGMRVLSRKEVEDQADAVIINTSESYWNTIYQRICDWKIPVYFRNGEQASLSEEPLSKDPYWLNNYQQLRQKMELYDVISFDIFNTLLMRRVYLPVDIFHIVENKLQKIYGKDVIFVEWRKRASSIPDNPSINEIYVKLRELAGWSEEQTEKAKEIEIETELFFIMARHDMVKLYQSISREKEVFLISDMYFPKEILSKMLTQEGIRIDQDHLLVSCDINKTKESGELWNYYSERILKGRKAFHVGDEEEADCNQPRKCGIDSWWIWSPAMMLQRSSLNKIVPYINSLRASIVIGLIESKLFNSPFSLNETKGKIVFKDEKEAGYCLLGNLICEFFEWLLAETKLDHVKQLAFFGREGYLLTGLFDKYCHILGVEDGPEPVYLEISRRTVALASVSNEQDVRELLQFPYRGTVAECMKERFGVETEDQKLCEIQWSDFTESERMKEEWIECYLKTILQESEWERKNYIKYLSALDLRADFAIVDSQLYGTTQYYLGKLLERRILGYYFCACLEKRNRYLEKNIMKGCFQKRDGEVSNIYKQAPFIEAFFTAPNGMLEYIEADGSRRYAEKMQNQKKFELRFEMVEGIREFMKDMIRVQKEFGNSNEIKDSFFADLLFGVFMDNGFLASEKMKESFWYDNRLAGNREVPIWE